MVDRELLAAAKSQYVAGQLAGKSGYVVFASAEFMAAQHAMPEAEVYGAGMETSDSGPTPIGNTAAPLVA